MRFVVVKRKKIILAVSLFLTVVVCSLSICGAVGVFSVKQRKLPIYSVETVDKKVALTFDCAWGVEYTDRLLSITAEKEVSVTFFAVEFWVKKYPDYVKKIVDGGHEMGTHSSTHSYMSKLSEQAIIKEIESSSEAIENITGKRVELFRPPYGDYDDLLIETAQKCGVFVIQWDVDSLDWKDLSSAQIYQRVTERVKNGSIVLFHNNGIHTADALPRIIDKLKNDGYEFVKVGDLIYRDNYKIATDGRQIKNV